jgi:hypothetical protein
VLVLGALGFRDPATAKRPMSCNSFVLLVDRKTMGILEDEDEDDSSNSESSLKENQ